jgi:hypothetical protein
MNLWQYAQAATVPYRIRMAATTYTAQLRGVSATRTAGLTITGTYSTTFKAHEFLITVDGEYDLWFDALGGSNYVKDAAWSGSTGKYIQSSYFDNLIDTDLDYRVDAVDDSVVALNNLTTAAYNYIGSGGNITNNPDDVTIENKTGSTLGIKSEFLVDSLSASDTTDMKTRNIADGGIIHLDKIAVGNPNGGGKFFVGDSTLLENGVFAYDHPTPGKQFRRDAKLEDLTPTWAGAKSDGSTNDSSAFKRTWEFAKSLDAFTYNLPPDTSNIGEMVFSALKQDNITIKGNSSVLLSDRQFIMLFDSCQNLTLSDFELKTTNSTDASNGASIYIRGNSRNVHLENLYLINHIRQIVVRETSSNVWIENCIIETLSDGVAVINVAGNADSVFINNNIIKDSGSDNAEVQCPLNLQGSNIYVFNNKIGSPSPSVTALLLEGTGFAEISHNTIDNRNTLNTSFGINIQGSPGDIKVHDNTVFLYDSTSTTAVGINFYSKTAGETMENNYIYNNTIWNGSSGIIVSTQDSAMIVGSHYIENNWIHNTNSYPIFIDLWENQATSDSMVSVPPGTVFMVKDNEIYNCDEPINFNAKIKTAYHDSVKFIAVGNYFESASELYMFKMNTSTWTQGIPLVFLDNECGKDNFLFIDRMFWTHVTEIDTVVTLERHRIETERIFLSDTTYANRWYLNFPALLMSARIIHLEDMAAGDSATVVLKGSTDDGAQVTLQTFYTTPSATDGTIDKYSGSNWVNAAYYVDFQEGSKNFLEISSDNSLSGVAGSYKVVVEYVKNRGRKTY